MFKHISYEKDMIYVSPGLIAPMEKVQFYEGFFFKVVMVMLKDKQKCIIKDTISIKISFMH